jgi:hypothetical protein
MSTIFNLLIIPTLYNVGWREHKPDFSQKFFQKFFYEYFIFGIVPPFYPSECPIWGGYGRGGVSYSQYPHIGEG